MSIKSRLKLLNRIVCFCVIGICLYYICEKVVVYKYYWPIDGSNITRSVKSMYREEENIDVLFMGTSHVMNAVAPLEFYEKYGVISYNIATHTQPIDMSYYLLKEAMKSNDIKVVVYDVSALFIGLKNGWWNPVLDAMPLSENKLEIASNISNRETNLNFWKVLFPMARQHERWKALNKTDFMFYHQLPSYSRGHILSTEMSGAIYSVEEMNNIVTVLQENVPYNAEIINGEYRITEGTENSLDYLQVMEENIEWFIKMKDLCDKNGIEFICIKVPDVYHPELYNSAWTLGRSNAVKELCSKNNITFYDLLYDADLEIDYTSDYADGGPHLNYLGAQKITNHLGEYLMSHYSLSSHKSAQWDYDLALYQQIRRLALLQLDSSFTSYIDRVRHDFSNQVIFIAAADDMVAGLNEDDMRALQKMGLQSDFRGKTNCSYIALIEHGYVKYENISNNKIGYSGTLKMDIPFRIESSGYYTGAKASIVINGIEYAMNKKGINIVVYDDEKNLLYDSVQFDTSSEVHYSVGTARRTECIRNLEEYLFEENR